ncbi:MAG: hypothetical protein AB8B79_00780 [Granulosicoccus sp.]
MANDTSIDQLVTQSLAACARSLAQDAAFELPDSEKDAASPVERGHADALALMRAHHDSFVHRQYAPKDPYGRLFDLLERERYEALGANLYEGVRINLDSRTCKVDQSSRAVTEQGAATLKLYEDALELLCRRRFRAVVNDAGMPPLHLRQSASVEYACIASVCERWLHVLEQTLDDQPEFAKQARDMLLDLAQRTQSGDVESMTVNDEGNTAELSEAPDDLDECVDPGDDDTLELGESKSEAIEEDASLQAQSESDDSESLPEHALDEAPALGPDPTIVVSGDTRPYVAYTTQFDEISNASNCADTESLTIWRQQLDEHIALHGRVVRRLAARLQRVLLARQKRHWQFDLEEGQLDSARLSRIISDPLLPLSFKTESEIAFRNTTITLLIDNSRSMLGRPIMIAAACADILARTLERCGVSVEILGFTTVHLHGGQSTDLWTSEGKPDNPGRLNDLRHIIYKSADMSYRSARKNLGLMLDKDILKQNIDGEALLWAHQRIMKRPEQRRILLTISDGAPVDTSTLGANAGDYLARHLQDVIEDIERSSTVELAAIGIGHDVSRFYTQAISVFDARQLGPVMLGKLENLLRQAA